jgi:hypothetical protein
MVGMAPCTKVLSQYLKTTRTNIYFQNHAMFPICLSLAMLNITALLQAQKLPAYLESDKGISVRYADCGGGIGGCREHQVDKDHASADGVQHW